MKKPLFNQKSESCIFYRKIFDKKNSEISPDWFSYLCIDCLNEYVKKWGIEFDE